MPAYRFCRTDDIPVLVEALNACYFVHFAEREPFGIADFKREIRELNIWSSSCMAVWEDREPIAVLTGAKREHETLIHRIGVHPDFMRRGHALHLLLSLSHKLSVLGPPKVVAEIPDPRSETRDLFVAAGYHEAGTLADFTLMNPPASLGPARKLVPIGCEDLLRDRLLNENLSRSWERDLETLRNCKDQLEGLAILSATRIEAYALIRDRHDVGTREIVALGCNDSTPSEEARPLLEHVIQVVSGAARLRITIPKVSEEEISFELLESMGFRKVQTYTRYVEFPGTRMH